MRFASILTILASLAIPTMLSAHPLHGETASFTSGMSHPLLGIDHILAMIAVGLWGRQMGGRAIWYLPLSFVTVMIGGFLLGQSGVTIPFVEEGIIGSILMLGVIIASAVRLPAAAGIGMVALFALFHGHGHGLEMPSGASAGLYLGGFVSSTIALHLAGYGLGGVLGRSLSSVGVRFAGGAIALGGLVLLML